MSLLRQLPRNPIKQEPDVWVKRLVLFEKVLPQPVTIRDIQLHRGLNIVWAEEPESTTDRSDIAGHSAGKTTFCRLLRYVLGEKTFGTKSGAQAIKKSFPNGYVAAEVMIKGVQWAVLRPLGENRNSWILRGGTVEEVVANKGEPAYQDTYPTQLGLAALLHGLRTATVVRTREEIKWGHMLAWCARDQEARFQNVYEWRSPRSDSEWPAFSFPKADPLFVMRVILGLYLPSELGAEETLSGHQRDLERAEDDLQRLKREPEYWQTHYHGKLRKALKEKFPDEAVAIEAAKLISDELMPDLRRYVAKAAFLADEDLDRVRKDLEPLQNQLNEINEAIAEAKGALRHFEALLNLEGKAATEIDSALDQAARIRALIEQNQHRVCPFGSVLIGECSHVHQWQNGAQPGEIQQGHALEQMEAQRAAAREQIAVQQGQLAKIVQEREARRDLILEEQRKALGRVHSSSLKEFTIQ